MGKSSKKSVTKVNTAPAIVSPTKAGKKVKREAEVQLPKQVAAKKQKRDENAEQIALKKKREAKKQNVKEESSDDSSSESEEEKPAAKKVAATKKKPASAPPPKGKPGSVSDSSSDDDTDSDEKTKKVPALSTKNGSVPQKKMDDSSDSSESEEDNDVNKSTTVSKKMPAKKVESTEDESSSDDDGDNGKAKLTKNGPSLAPKKKAESSESSDSDDSSDEDSEEDVKAPAQAKMGAIAPKSTLVASKKKTESSDDESSSDDEEEDVKAPAQAKTGALAPKTTPVASKKKTESSDDDSSDDEDKMDVDKDKGSLEDVPDIKKAKPAPASKSGEANTNLASKDSDSASSEDDDDDDEQPPKAIIDSKKDSDDSEESSEDEEDTPSKIAKNAMKSPATPKVESSSKTTLFVGNLSFNASEDDVANFFGDVGEVLHVRLANDTDGRFRGFGHVDFANSEAAKKALTLNGKELLGRPVKLDMAVERGAYTPHSGSNNSNSFQKGQAHTVFVRGFDTSLEVEEAKSSLQELFSSCGEISRISVPKNFDSGEIKGFAYVDFNDADSFNQALELNGSDLGGYSIHVDEAKPRGDSQSGGGRGGFGRSGGRGGFGRSGGRGGFGRSGGRGSGRDSGGRFSGGRSGRGGRGGGGRGGRGTPGKPNLAAPGTGTKTTFADD